MTWNEGLYAPSTHCGSAPGTPRTASSHRLTLRWLPHCARSMDASPHRLLPAIHCLPDAVPEELVEVLRNGVGLITLRFRRVQPLVELLHAGAEPLALGALLGE